MASSPFDPSPFIPAGHHSVDVAGRPARICILAGAVPTAHEEWAITTIVPMPNLPVQFSTIREVLAEFLTDVKHLGLSEISPCPFGQAYVKLNSVFDRDELVNNSPHPFTDVHVIFEKHNQGLNWRKLNLSKEVWILLCGFPLDHRSIHEINNAVCKFGKFVMWDRNKSYRANLMVKFIMEELRDIPASIVIGEGDDSATLSVPVVILQDTALGREAPDEDPIPPYGNPHPVPAQTHFHQNQHNHFIGPLQFHEKEAVQAPVQNPLLDNQLGIQVEDDDDMDDLPSWGHLAMQVDQELIDQELHAGEFMNLNELVEPLEEDLEHLEPPDHSVETATSVVGPLAPILPIIPDVNADIGPVGPLELVEPILAQEAHIVVLQAERRLVEPALEDLNLIAIPNVTPEDHALHSVDPMQCECSLTPRLKTVFGIDSTNGRIKSSVAPDTLEAPQLESTLQVLLAQSDPILSRDKFVPLEQAACEPPPTVMQQNEVQDPDLISNAVDPMIFTEGEGESSSSDDTAPPGFPVPIFMPDNLNDTGKRQISSDEQGVEIKDEEKYLGKEGAIENTPNSMGGSQEITSSSTSAMHQNRKRKDKGPLVEIEVNAQDTTEDKITTKIKKPKCVMKLWVDLCCVILLVMVALNIRGINDPKKWDALSNKIAESACSTICLQETKRDHFATAYIRKFCPKNISKFEFLPSNGASGGLLIAWNEQLFSGLLIHQNDYSLTINFTCKLSGTAWKLTNIYGPCQQDARVDFLDWFKNYQVGDDENWLVLGDFNYIRYHHNRNKDGGSINDMFLFNEAISNQALVEIPLKGRKFTWSNMQEAPLLEKPGWCFTSEAWTLMFSSTQAIPLAKTTSDHIPIVIKVGTCIPRSQIFRFENFWLKHPQFEEVVKNNWEQEVHETDSAKCIAAKFKRLRKGLKIWAKTISNLKDTIQNINFMILFYDVIEEYRDLSVEQSNGRRILIDHLSLINEHQRIYWKRRATIRNIKMGEANTKYFQAKATIKHRFNHIAMLKDEEDHEHADHNAKAAILFRAFKKRLGSVSKTENPLLLQSLLLQHDDLSDLEIPFTKKEIHDVIMKMPADKAPGPDGFNATFLKACWDIVAPDFYRLIEDFYLGTVNL
ncbi:uncharacterized protein [Aegilops tauschii subsp. strangulata]|uniref:uncharacterized protein n=1 Tax=Aegilops tauschii subsp. strangulata TaxID=200361 RepID=UPI003CC8DDD9